MNDMRAVIVPKSDQLNADDLLAGPMTITITSVTIRPGTEQPVSIFFEGDNGKPYKCCKSMARVMVHCWGADANNYVGRSMTLYCDPKVQWGGMAVGGIRISNMSHIDGPHTMALTATKGRKNAFTVSPLVVERAPTFADQSPAERWPTLFGVDDGTVWLQNLMDVLASVKFEEELSDVEGLSTVQGALANAPTKVKQQIIAALAQATERTGPRIDNAPEHAA